MPDAPARLLRLLALLQSRPDWPGADLAVRLGVTARTLRRDVSRLRDLGYPVHAAPGVAGGYRLGRGASLPPLLLDGDEAMAVVVGLRGTAGTTVAGLAEASVLALAKLDQVLPARLRERTAALRHATVALGGPGPAIDTELLTALAAACRAHRRLSLRYTDRDGAASDRTVEPHRLVSTGYRWYLMAFDTGRDDWRTFRVDRISWLGPPGPPFAPRQAPDAASFVATAVTTAPYRYQARILVHAPAQEVARHVSPAAGIIAAQGEHRCVLTAGADSLDALAFHLGLLGAEFTVLEPPELAGRLREIAARLRRAAGQVPAAVTPPGAAPGPG